MAKYGKTRWGEKWLQFLNKMVDNSRLLRGKAYANIGRVSSIKINDNVIIAKVYGSGQSYRVELILNEFGKSEQQIIRQIIETSPTILPELMNKQLPVSLFDELSSSGIRLFPSKLREIHPRCDCPDAAVPCKHIAAVIYLIAAEIDQDPFMIFKMHNCNLPAIIDNLNKERQENAQKILKIDDLFNVRSQPKIHTDCKQADIDFSIIPNLASCINQVLKDSPSFFERSFHQILQVVYKHWQKYPTGKQEYRLQSSKKKLSEEELFTKIWGNIENWKTFQLFIDGQYNLTQIYTGEVSAFTINYHSAKFLAHFLNNIPSSMLHKLNSELRFMHMISQFARVLMEKSALIPQILQNAQGKLMIRWVPALFNVSVKETYDKISSMCPSQLVQYKGATLNSEEQVNIAMSFILLGYMTDNLPAAFDRYKNKYVFELFFTGRQYRLDEFSDKELPQAINLWLLRLYSTDRIYTIYLVIEDYHEGFELNVRISLDNATPPVKLNKALSKQNTKLSILSDLALLFEYIPKLEKSTNGLLFDLDDFASLFLDILPVLKVMGIIVILPKSLQRILNPALNLNLSAKDKDCVSFLGLESLLEFDWQVAIGERKLSITEFKKLIRDSSSLVRIVDRCVLLDDKEMEAFLKKLDKLPNRLNQAEVMQAALTGELDEAKVALDRQLTDLFNKLNAYKPVMAPSNLSAQLRPYQERGFSWLMQNIEAGFGSIIADDMGLGKTLQVIAAVLYCKNMGFLDRDRVLVVAPTSILSNWQREVERFAPDLKLLIYHGQNRELVSDYDIALTSYGLARRDKAEFNKIRWFLLIIDEAQNIKNPDAEQTKAIKAIKAKHKIAMSGTPIENRLLEYWSIFDFTNKLYLGTSKQFKTRFATPIEKTRDEACLDRLMKITKPFMLRRLKSDKSIIQDLPDKIENNRYCFLTAEQAALYQKVIDGAMERIEESEGIERKALILRLINFLKQVCNHPSQFGKKKHASIEQSGKMQMLEEILMNIVELAEKSLIFTQYTEMGEIISKLLEERFSTKIPFLHGGLSRKARDVIINDFQNSLQFNILIVSLKAGGTGLNLTAANHVIHYDLWWNPAVEAQATDRAYRIGQKHNVMVYRLISSGTFEERINEMIQSKKELANLTISSGESWITEFSNNQLRDLVKIKNAC